MNRQRTRAMVAHLRVENLTPPLPDRAGLRVARLLRSHARVRALAIALVLASPLAHADDCDIADAAGGSWSTYSRA